VGGLCFRGTSSPESNKSVRSTPRPALHASYRPYMIHPGTAFYIGYTNRMENVAIDPTAPGRLRLTASPGTTTGRLFFAKFSYLFTLVIRIDAANSGDCVQG
jgi:hypothetical protein